MSIPNVVPKVILVEDNERNRKLARDLLEHLGYQVLESDTAAEGLRLAREQHPALLVLDVWLPDFSGLKVLDRLRADPATRHIPVMAVTALAMAEERRRIEAAGFDAYLTKPIDVREFLATAQTLVEQGRNRSQTL